jgi:hypothetical protein
MADLLPHEPSRLHAFTRARAIFESALETDGPERERLVRDACGNDATLRATVERMLRPTRRRIYCSMVAPCSPAIAELRR